MAEFNNYKLYQADGRGGGSQLYESMRNCAITQYITKHNLPVDLDRNKFFVECGEDAAKETYSLYEFNTKCFEGKIKDTRGAYTLRKD